MINHYLPILRECEPFLIAHHDVRPQLNLAPGGMPIPPDNVLHPQHMANGRFLELLARLDGLTFGPFGMHMPSWVFYDCAVMPGAVFGLAMRAERVPEWARESLGVPADYLGLVPMAQFIAIPVLSGFASGATVPTTWLMYTLETINEISPGIAPHGLIEFTLWMGLQVFPIQELQGTVQWRSPKLATLAHLGPLELLTAWTPAHSLPRTLTFKMHLRDLHLQSVLLAPRAHPDAPPPNALIDVDDEGALRQLQRDIEAGHRIQVVGQPTSVGCHVRVPIFRAAPTAA
ncbi:MAG: hypothetical protein FJ100_01345 [Deltaproteobacteria bacterium]|nr:hypothetical protein [Deltaproteobacteria bacterium]